MWPKAYLAILITLWLVLDYRLYAAIDRHAYPVVALLIVLIGLWLARRCRMQDVSLRWPKAGDWHLVALVLAGLVIMLIPLGIILGFIHFNPTPVRLRRTLIEAIPIFVVIALPEEIIFRGVIQKTLLTIWRSQALAIAVAALLFGLAHLHKGAPVPNWRYALLAGLAGAGYGIAFWRRGLMAASLTHALVDILWRMFFR
jgi:hypothetical protein